MPANRSRNERFRESFQQICDKGGCLEFSVAPLPDAPGQADAHQPVAPDLLWRVRLLHVTDRELIVEHPTAAGKTLKFLDGVPLVGVMGIGQNRWMFRTRTLSSPAGVRGPAGPGTLRLSMPDSVERCTRREFLRVQTAELHLPVVSCWPLLDPGSVPAAETANRAMLEDCQRTGRVWNESSGDLMLPVVGPQFQASLVNMGGGGLGLLVPKTEARGIAGLRLAWLRMDLRPSVPVPLGMVGKIVHQHLDSAQNVYCGVSFEFAFHPPHRDFVTAQVEAYINRLQLQRRAA